MLWELSVTEQRYRAVLEVMAGIPVTEVAERYGVSRQSVHAWLSRYRDEGPPGLEDRSHEVHAHPWQIPAELESAICELRRAHRKWGPKRLVFEMGRRGLGTVARSTVYRVLVRNQLIEPPSRRRGPGSRTTRGKMGRRHQPRQAEMLDVQGPFESLAALQAALDAGGGGGRGGGGGGGGGMAFPASRFVPAASPLPLRVPPQL